MTVKSAEQKTSKRNALEVSTHDTTYFMYANTEKVCCACVCVSIHVSCFPGHQEAVCTPGRDSSQGAVVAASAAGVD